MKKIIPADFFVPVACVPHCPSHTRSLQPRQLASGTIKTGWCHRLLIQSDMSFSTSGDMVSSMLLISVGSPVLQCCSMWFSPG